MRVVLADLKGSDGFVSKDTVVGGYGSRLTPFTRVTSVIYQLKRRLHDPLSVQMAYLGAIAAAAGHEVVFTDSDEPVDGDVAIVLSSLVDYRHETAWADAMRARGVPVGFVGLTASKLPQLFADHADFIITGEPEEAFTRLTRGEELRGQCASSEIGDLDSLPFPRWDLLTSGRRRDRAVPLTTRPCTADSLFWPAAAAPSSAPTVRTASCRNTARGRLKASSMRSKGSASATRIRT